MTTYKTPCATKLEHESAGKLNGGSTSRTKNRGSVRAHLPRAAVRAVMALVLCLAIVPVMTVPSTAYAVTSYLCVCGFMHTNMMGHMSPNMQQYDSETGPIMHEAGAYDSMQGKWNSGVYMLAEDQVLNEKSYPGFIVNENQNVVLYTDGYDITFDFASSSNFGNEYIGGIYVDGGATLTISGYSSEGRTTQITSSNLSQIEASTNLGTIEYAAIVVRGGATLNLYGVDITMTSANTSGIFVCRGGTVNIYAGTYNGYPSTSLNPTRIINCTGYGIKNFGGNVNIYGGEISGNAQGGVYAQDFLVSGGCMDANVTMYGGTIKNNTGSGIYLDSFWDDLGEVSGGQSSVFSMYAGTITGNGTSSGTGGGVYVKGRRARMELHGEAVSTSIADTGSGNSSIAKLGRISITGNNGATGPNVYVNNRSDSDPRISVTLGSDNSLRGYASDDIGNRSEIGITIGRCADGTTNEDWVTSDSAAAAAFFTSDVSGYGISTKDGKVTQVKKTDAQVSVKEAVVDYTGSSIDASVVDNNSGIDGAWSWKYSNVKNAGTYRNVTVIFTPADTGRYNGPVEKTATVTVRPKTLTIDNLEVADKEYDGTGSASYVSTPTLVGVASGDDVSLSGGTPRFPQTDVGSDLAIIFAGFSLSGSSVSNYTVAQPTGIKADITARAITATITPGGGTYGETITPASATLSGVLGGESVPVSLTYTGTADDGTVYASTEAPTLAGTYTVTASIADANYTLAGTTTASFVVAKRALTVEHAQVKDKTYDGTTAAEFAGTPSLSGVVWGDRVALSNGAPRFSQANAGENLAITFDFSLTGDDAANYTVIQPTDITADIAAKAVTVNITPGGGTYGEAITPASATLSGVLDGDTVPVTLTYTGMANNGTSYNSVTPPTLAGSYTVTASITDANYTLSGLTTADVVVVRQAQAAPAVAAQDETIAEKADGGITGLSTAMEISDDSGHSWAAVTSAEASFAAGTYLVRYAQDANHEASPAATVTINAGRKLVVSVPAEQTGYTLAASATELAWGESTTLTFALAEGYSKTDDFKVLINGATDVTAAINADGAYVLTPVEDAAAAVSGVADITAPDVTLAIRAASWKQFLYTISFGLFFRDDVENPTTAYVTASDAGSGLAGAEYLLSATALATEEAATTASGWTALTPDGSGRASFTLDTTGAAYLYVRVTDNAGNICVAGPDGGVVVYENSAAATAAITYTKATTDDVTAQVSLNGNTVASISNGTTTLTAGTDYVIGTDGTITFAADYLDTLAAGNYTLTIAYDPQGKAYQDYVVDGTNMNDRPATSALTLTVVRQTGSVSITGDLDKVYDGAAVSLTSGDYATNNPTGQVQVAYKVKGADDSTYSAAAPKDANDYTVRVTVAGDDSYTEAQATQDFIISARDVSIAGATVEQSRIYDGTTAAEVTSAGTLSGVLDGEEVTIVAGTAAYANKHVGESKAVSFSGFTLAGSSAGNYRLVAQPPDTTADITTKSVTVTNVQVKDKMHDGTDAAQFAGTPALSGVAEGDDVTLSPGIPTFSQVDVGDDIAIQFTAFTLSGDDADNYTLVQPAGITASIAPFVEKTYTVVYNPAGGRWSDGSMGVRTVTLPVTEPQIIPEAPTREGYTFVEWHGSSYQPGETYNEKNDDGYVSDELVAVWKRTGATPDKETTPSTGDGAPVGWALVAAAGSLALAGGAIFKVKRRRDD